MEPMKTLTIDGTTFEVIDDAARNDITNIIKRNKQAITIGAADIANQVFFDEADASGGKLYFYTYRLCLMNTGYMYDKYWKDIISDTGATEISTSKLPKCIEIPNDTALCFNVSTGKFEFIERYAIQNEHLVLFLNAYGRADNLHPTLMKAILAQIEKKTASIDEMKTDIHTLQKFVGNDYLGINDASMLGEWQLGGLSSGKIVPSQTYRVVTSKPITLSKPLTVEIQPNRRISVHYLNEDGSLKEDTGWQTDLYVFRANVPFMCLISGFPSSSAEENNSTADVKTFVKYITYQNELSKALHSLYERIVNVRDYGAKGDGTTDDTGAIQNAIMNGRTIYFPDGTYLLNKCLWNASNASKSSALYIAPHQRLIFDPGAVLLRGSDAVNHMLYTGNDSNATDYNGASDIEIIGATFDENESLSTNCTALNLSHANNIKIKDCKFVNASGTWHSIEVNSSKNVDISGCIFENNSNEEDIQIDSANRTGNLGASDGTPCDNIHIHNCVFSCNGNPAIGGHDRGNHKNIRVYNNTFSGDGGSRGYCAFTKNTDFIDVYNNTFEGGTLGVSIPSPWQSNTIHDNRFYAVTTPVGGEGFIQHDNLILDPVPN